MSPSAASEMPCVLSIAGSDSGGGAGIQADLKTMCARNVYGATVVTALTAQNTVGVQSVHVPPPEFIAEQLRSVLSDIPISVVKTGMLPDEATVRAVCSSLREHASTIKHIVVDPVLVATSGDALAGGGCVDAIKRELFPLATVVTPNIPEASKLTGCKIDGIDGMREACAAICAMGAGSTLLKGGHLQGNTVATDVLFDGREFEAFTMPWVDSRNTHGTGCTLASCVASELAKGTALPDAVRIAKLYVHDAIRTSYDIGRGHGPLNHMHLAESVAP